jgi:hypothetical protein
VSDALAEARRVRAALDEKWTISRKLRLAVEILPVYVRARWLLARRDLPATLEALRSMPALPEVEELDAQLIGIRFGRAVERTLGPLPADSRCLIKSLVLLRLLARRGIQASFIIGVQPAPTFKAHAWVERGAVPLISAGDGRYERLVEL